jgi:hypothetical protein
MAGLVAVAALAVGLMAIPASAVAKSGGALSFATRDVNQHPSLSSGRIDMAASAAGRSAVGASAAGILGPATPAAMAPVQQLPLFGGEYFAKHYMPTLAQALAQAKAFDFILASRTDMYRAYATAMHVANPRLKIVTYLDGGFANPATAKTAPSTWFALDSKGRRITSLMFGNYLMDPSSSGWTANRSTLCGSMLKATPGYDGCVVDSVGLSPLYPGYVSSLPFNKATGKNWTPGDWLKASSKMVAAIKIAVSPKWVIINGLSNGHAYFNPASPTSQLLAGVDGGMAETFVRNAFTPIGQHPSLAVWQEDVHMISDAAARGKFVLAVVKIWVSGTAAQYAAWNMYSMSTFLMGYNGGFAYYHFRLDKSPSSTAIVATTLGTPTGAYYKTAKGYYERDFSTGVVFANPGNSSYTITLPKPLKTLSGTVVTSVTLGPTSGVILHA